MDCKITFRLFIAGVISILPCNVKAQPAVEQWACFEKTVKASSSGNPFSEVDFRTGFWQEDSNDTVVVTGFYDGNDRYIIRFMPFQPGLWHYRTESNVASLSGVSGSFRCIPAVKDHGPVRIRDMHSFQYADGTPYYPLGTTAYAWIHMPGNIQEETLASLKEARFNKLRMCVFPKDYNLVKEEPEVYPYEVKEVRGEKRIFDFTRFNPEYFHRLEKRINELKTLGIEVDLILFHPYDKGRWGFDSMPEDVNLAYIRYICARLAPYSNVWWSLANEYDYVKSKTEEDWNILIKEVRKSDPYHHLCSIHGSTATYFPYWSDEITHVSIQDEAPVEEAGRAPILRNIYRKPVVADEVGYEGNLPNRWGRLSGPEMLHRIWQGLTAGIYVTHGECYRYYENPDTVFWAKGGRWRGESWKRIPFTRQMMEDVPNPLQMADVSRDCLTSTGGPGYYLLYFGKEMKDAWIFNLPEKNADYMKLKPGTKFKVEIIDTWNMTVTPYPQIFETGEVTDYRLYDMKNRLVRLPMLPYLLLRITEI